jgi:hypothetical protein
LKKIFLAFLAITLVALVAVSCASLVADTDTPGHKTTSAASAPAAEATPDGPATSFQDGSFLVGTDIEAGTYKTSGDDTGLGCYWERASDDSGSLDAIITNNYGEGPQRVTVKTGETFKVSGDCEWRLVR